MKLERSSKKDIPYLAEIYRTEFSKPPYNEVWTTEKALSKMKKFLEDYDLYSIFFEKDLVGFIPSWGIPRSLLRKL